MSAIKDRESLFAAIDGFVTSNSNFESTKIIKMTIEAVGDCEDLQTAFAVPLRNQLFNFDAALKWVLFLSYAPAESLEDGDAPFEAKFSASRALSLITQVYDRSFQEHVIDYFEPEDDDEEESDEDEEAAAAADEPAAE